MKKGISTPFVFLIFLIIILLLSLQIFHTFSGKVVADIKQDSKEISESVETCIQNCVKENCTDLSCMNAKAEACFKKCQTNTTN